jgi:hypothetical protein
MASSGVLRRVALVRTDVSEQLSASFMRVTRIDQLGTTLAVSSNRRTQRSGQVNFRILQKLNKQRVTTYEDIHGNTKLSYNCRLKRNISGLLQVRALIFPPTNDLPAFSDIFAAI